MADKNVSVIVRRCKEWKMHTVGAVVLDNTSHADGGSALKEGLSDNRVSL